MNEERVQDCISDLIRMRSRLPDFLLNPDPDIYNTGSYVVLDFETTIVGGGSALREENSLVLAMWYNNVTEEAYSAWGNEYQMDRLVEDCQEADFIVAHNAKFELQWLARCGLDLGNVLVYDTMIGEYVIAGNMLAWNALGLEASGQRRFGEGKDGGGIISKMYKAKMCSNDIPQSWLYKYCLGDIRLTYRLFQAQLEELNEKKLMGVMYTRCLTTTVLADIETNGMYLDESQVVDMTSVKEEDYAAITLELEQLTSGINTNSPKQLGGYLYDTLGFDELKNRRGKVIRSESGGRKTDQDTIAGLKAKTSDQRKFLELYKGSKALYNELTKYLRKFSDCCTDAGGWLRAEFNQTRTRTHRLSSSGLDYKTQFQNFPRAYKTMFKARNEGWLIGEGDGAQLEFRVAAHLGRDKVAREDIISGTDIHQVTADIIGVSRQEAKAHTFKPLYGGMSGSPAEVKYYEFFKEKYCGIADTQREWINSVLENKELITEWGMRYYWPNTRMDRSGYISNSTSICNYPVQAFATAEIIPIALVYCWHYIRRLGLEMLMVNTVHDSIIMELPPHEIEMFHALMKHCLITEVEFYLDEVYDVRFTVPLGAGVSVASHWGDKEAEEFTYVSETYSEDTL